MPLLVLALAFALKLFIDRTTTLPDAIESALELPVDIVFLATSLVVGYTISPSGSTKEGLAWFGFYILGAILIVFLWRRSRKSYDAKSSKTSLGLAAASYFLSITALVFAIRLVTTVHGNP